MKRQKRAPRWAPRKSIVKGVRFDTRQGTWRGQKGDATERSRNGKDSKIRFTAGFPEDDEAGCIAAFRALEAALEAKAARVLHELAQARAHTRDLPPRPAKAAEAKRRTAYYSAALRCAKGAALKEFRPDRYVRAGSKWQLCCQHGVGADACTFQAVPRAIGAPWIKCLKHGGGCPHGRSPHGCGRSAGGIICDEHAFQKMNNCSRACGVILNSKRQVSHGGSGLCPSCEDTVESERAAELAAMSGKPPPPAAKGKAVVKAQEHEMLRNLVLSGYVESADKGFAPLPGQFIRELYVDYRCVYGKDFLFDEKRYAYVDFVVNPKQGGKLVFLEIDEGQHKSKSYNVSCDAARMFNVTEMLRAGFSGDTNVLWLRVNPDTRFLVGEEKHNPTNTERCKAICRFLDCMDVQRSDPPMAVAYAFYDMDRIGDTKVVQHPDYPQQVRDCVVRFTHYLSHGGVGLELEYKR